MFCKLNVLRSLRVSKTMKSTDNCFTTHNSSLNCHRFCAVTCSRRCYKLRVVTTWDLVHKTVPRTRAARLVFRMNRVHAQLGLCCERWSCSWNGLVSVLVLYKILAEITPFFLSFRSRAPSGRPRVRPVCLPRHEVLVEAPRVQVPLPEGLPQVRVLPRPPGEKFQFLNSVSVYVFSLLYLCMFCCSRELLVLVRVNSVSSLRGCCKWRHVIVIAVKFQIESKTFVLWTATI